MSVGLLGNAADVYREILERGVVPDVVTDQTSAHDPVHGYLPSGWSIEQWKVRQEYDPNGTAEAAKLSMAEEVRTIITFKEKGAITLD